MPKWTKQKSAVQNAQKTSAFAPCMQSMNYGREIDQFHWKRFHKDIPQHKQLLKWVKVNQVFTCEGGIKFRACFPIRRTFI
jgi:hypothetical protein